MNLGLGNIRSFMKPDSEKHKTSMDAESENTAKGDSIDIDVSVISAKETSIDTTVSEKTAEENKDDSTKADVTTEAIGEEQKEDTAQIANTQEAPKTKRKPLCVCKMGSDHTFANMNNHDFAFNLPNMKVVMDGCGSGKHSEVGTRLFGQLFARKLKEYIDKGESVNEENFIDVVNSIFEKMLELCNDTAFIFQNYCFTILVCFETDDEFVVYSCGDGYIVKENEEGITFDKLDDGEYPCYYIYNFITDKSALIEYKDGVSFKVSRFAKADYSNVGVASDGLRYSKNLLDTEKNKLMKFLSEGKGPQIESLINRNNKYGMFHDDISICF